MLRKLLICVALLFLVSSAHSGDIESEPTKIDGFWNGVYIILTEYASDLFNLLGSVNVSVDLVLNSVANLIATVLLNIQNTILAVLINVTQTLQDWIPNQLGGDTLEHLNQKKAFCYTNNTQLVIVRTLQTGVECVKSPLDKLVDHGQEVAVKIYALVVTIADETSRIKNSQGLGTTVDAFVVLIKTKTKFLFSTIYEIIAQVFVLLTGVPSVILCFFPTLVVKVLVWLGKEIFGYTKCLLFENV